MTERLGRVLDSRTRSRLDPLVASHDRVTTTVNFNNIIENRGFNCYKYPKINSNKYDMYTNMRSDIYRFYTSLFDQYELG